MKPLVVSGLCLMVAGCNLPSRDSAFLARVDSASPIHTAPIGAPDAAGPSEAILLLAPEAGGVLRIRERHFRNGTRQEVVVAGGTSGENVLEVSVRTSGGDNAPRGDLQIGKPSQRGIASESAARFPGMRLHVVTRPMSNAYGAFGLAVGRRANGERCIFAWQWIEDIRSAGGRGAGFASLLSGGGTPASVRLRMCRTNMTLDEMAGFMEALRPASEAALDRISRLDRRMIASGGVVDKPGAGSREELIAPLGGSLEAALPPIPAANPVAAAPKPVVAARAAAERKPAKREQATRPARSSPETRSSRPAVAESPQQGFGFTPAGPRYLAPLDGAGPETTGSAVTRATPLGPSRLDSSLPSRAYLGPSAAYTHR